MPLSAANEHNTSTMSAMNGNGAKSEKEQAREKEHSNSIRSVCVRLNERVQAFLEEETEDELLKKVQAQTRVALGVISAALEKYRCAYLPTSISERKLIGTVLRRYRYHIMAAKTAFACSYSSLQHWRHTPAPYHNSYRACIL